MSNLKNRPISDALSLGLTEAYLKKMFQAYYRGHIGTFQEDPILPQREFAFINWDRVGMQRHIGFPSLDFLKQFLVTNGPRHSYYSGARYRTPHADKMELKGYMGCDFIADIDADHIPTPCRQDHNFAVCQGCNTVFKGDKPESCSKCGHSKFDVYVWICNQCLDTSKQQVHHLIDNFLTKEFAIPLEDIKIKFSGHRGYHIHIESEQMQRLDQDARREIADYVTGQGFAYDLWQFTQIQNIMRGFTLNQTGWRGKIASELFTILQGGDSSIRNTFDHPIYGDPLPSKITELLTRNRQDLLGRLERRLEKNLPSWQIAGISEKTWIRIFEILRDRIKADIDVVVSIDLHRLIRLNGSLHGKTGLSVKSVSNDALDEFQPLNDALSFPVNQENLLHLVITSPMCPKIRIADTDYGPYDLHEKVKVPLNVGLYLLCKNVALLIDS